MHSACLGIASPFQNAVSLGFATVAETSVVTDLLAYGQFVAVVSPLLVLLLWSKFAGRVFA
jgi:hypothetical protein